jgi:hypothetical protein
MRISDDTKFPHPVLSSYSDDFAEGAFEVAFSAEENLANGALRLRHAITLTHDSILQLVTNGSASVGVLVRCKDTYVNDLRLLSWPEGSTEFLPGSLVNTVNLRPIVWVNRPLLDWTPPFMNPEFEGPVTLSNGDVIAFAAERVLTIGQAKMTPLESIFELQTDETLPEHRIQVDPHNDRIVIRAASSLYDALNVLRGQQFGSPAVLNGVYMPAVMEVLDHLREGAQQFEHRRWHQPFMAKCEFKGVDVSSISSTLEAAQILLDSPARSLMPLASE